MLLDSYKQKQRTYPRYLIVSDSGFDELNSDSNIRKIAGPSDRMQVD